MKRFIDTELFSDEWFMNLSQEAKLLYIYMFTNCNHAGIINLNVKLAEFQTGIKDIPSIIKQLGNRLERVSKVSENVYYLTKFIKFQYPNFPNSNVKQQESALKILNEYGIYFNSNGTVRKDLGKSYGTVKKDLGKSYGIDNDNGNDNDNDNDNGNGNEIDKSKKINKGKLSFEEIEFPDLLLEVKGFKESFENWFYYRKEIKKPLTSRAVKMQIKKLISFHQRGMDIVEVLDRAIINGWTGFYEIKANPKFTNGVPTNWSNGNPDSFTQRQLRENHKNE